MDECEDVDNDDESSGELFQTALRTSSSRRSRRVYTFRDIEDSIESFAVKDDQDVKLWLSHLESVTKTTLWYDEQRLSYEKLKKELIN